MSIALTKIEVPLIRNNFNSDLAPIMVAREKSLAVVKLEALEAKAKIFAGHVASSLQTIIGGVSDLTSHTNETAAVFRKLHKYTWIMVERLSNSPGFFKKLIGLTERYVSYVDAIQVVSDVNYIAQKGWKEKISADGKTYKPADSKATMAAKAAMTVTDTGATLLWFESMGFLNLKQAAASLGNTRIFNFVPTVVANVPVIRDVKAFQTAANSLGNLRVFSFMTKVSPLFVTLRALDLMYAFFAIDAAQRIVKADSPIKKTSAGLDLSSYLAELTLSAVVLAGVGNVVVLGTMGAACITLALTAFFYRNSHQAELKHEMPKTLQLIKV